MKTPRDRNLTAGFTALEVVVSTALASLMMVAVLGVLAGIAKKEQLLADRADANPAWQRQFCKQLRHDLASASTIRVAGNAIELTGFGGRRKGVPLWEPVEIRYWIAEADGQPVLIRQSHPLIQPSEPFVAEIVCLGVDQIRFETDGAEDETSSRKSEFRPGRIHVQLLHDGQAVLDEVIWAD